MRGIVRPCRHSLGPDLGPRWQAHLCGLCLTLREVAGQPERVLTGYDVLLLSVLVEAQAGAVATEVAAPCPLRGFTRATVVASGSGAGRLAAAGALLSGGAGLSDKTADGDLPRLLRRPADGVARRLSATGRRVAAEVGLDPGPVLAAPERSGEVESRPDATLAELLAPTGEAVAALFAHTAVVAGRPGNAAALAEAGRAFGCLVHLLDAVEDRAADAAAGRHNPLTATGTSAHRARDLAHGLAAQVRSALAEADLADRSLVDELLGRELGRAVQRALPQPPLAAAVPAQRAPGVLALLAALWALVLPAVFVGGTSGSCGPRRRRTYGYGPRGPVDAYGYPVRTGYGHRTGPGLGQCLACNCCANVLCNACCCCANS